MRSSDSHPPVANNRSMPSCTVIPVLHYASPPEAASWLCDAFGFTERLRIGSHRIQISIAGGAGAVVVAQGPEQTPAVESAGHSIMVRVSNVDEHFERAKARGARVPEPPKDYPYGERQYSAVDPGGHVWTFSQTIADVEPSSWGGTLLVQL